MSVDILRTSWDQCRSMVQYSFTSMETRRLMRTDSPGRPPWLSHSSWTMMLEPKLIVILYKTELLWTWCVCENMFNIFLFQEKLSVAAFSYTHVCSCPKWQTVEEISSKWGGWGAKLFSVLDPMESCDAVPRKNSNSALYPCTALAAFPWAGVGMECLFSVYTPPPLHKLVLVWGVCFQSPPPHPAATLMVAPSSFCKISIVTCPRGLTVFVFCDRSQTCWAPQWPSPCLSGSRTTWTRYWNISLTLLFRRYV